MKLSSITSGIVGLVSLWSCGVSAVAPPPYPSTRTRVSLHPSLVKELSDPDYKLWKVSNEDSKDTFSANGLTFTLSTVSSGSEFLGGYNKAVYTKPLPSVGQRLIGSGITTDNSGGSIALTITGLPAGEHSLSTWHNAWKDLDEVPTIAITLNGVSQISGRPGSVLENNMYDSAESWVHFESDGGPVKIVYKPSKGNMYLNGFEIDSESIGRQIRHPFPRHFSTGVPTTNDAFIASWKPTFNVDGGTYTVYIGTSATNLKRVAVDLIDPVYKFTDLEPGTSYYWRVDVKDTWWNEMLLGRTFKFTTD
jgi:hypothetical protein